MRALDTWRSTLSKRKLLVLMREQIREDRQLWCHLELQAASTRGNLAPVRARIRELFGDWPCAQYRYVEYADARAAR